MVGGPVNLFIAETSRGVEKPLLLLLESARMGAGSEDERRRA